MAGMGICSNGHDEICYVDNISCPLCDAMYDLKELEDADERATEAEEEVAKLEEYIAALEDEVTELREESD